jgi:alpha-beta hydrolase superfamily lysophospholipase
MEELFYPSHDEKTTIHACIWRPQTKPLAVVQIIHGMAEYAERYAPFAEGMARCGFAVVAEDHLGHGKSVTGEEKLGYFCEENPVETVLDDIFTLTQKAKEMFPEVPYFVLGHSMGSFFCRNIIADHGQEFDGAILMGTGWQASVVLNLALALTKNEASGNSWEYRSELINQLAFGAYNKKFPSAGNNFAWLSVNKKNVDNYLSDPLCGFTFTCNGFYTLFSVIKLACQKSTIKKVPKDLPVLFVSGSNDPVGNFGVGVQKAYRSFLKCGISDVTVKLYEGYRHEILNDVCAPQVTFDIISFIKTHMQDKA